MRRGANQSTDTHLSAALVTNALVALQEYRFKDAFELLLRAKALLPEVIIKN